MNARLSSYKFLKHNNKSAWLPNANLKLPMLAVDVTVTIRFVTKGCKAFVKSRVQNVYSRVYRCTYIRMGAYNV